MASTEIGERTARRDADLADTEAGAGMIPDEEDVPTRIHRLVVKGIETAIVGIVTAAFVTLVSFLGGFFEVPDKVEKLSAELHAVEASGKRVMEMLESHQKISEGVLKRFDQDLSSLNAAHTAMINEALRRIEAHRVQIATLTQALFAFQQLEDRAHDRGGK